MITQKPAMSIRNPFGPRADRLSLALPIDTGTGSSLEDEGLGYPVTNPLGGDLTFAPQVLDGSTDNPYDLAWNSDSEGSYLYLDEAGTHYVDLFSNTGDTVSFTRGTILIRFSFASLDQGFPQPIFNSGRHTSNPNQLTIVKQSDDDKIRITHSDSSNQKILFDVDWDSSAFNAIHTLIYTWGETGSNMWMDGTESTVSIDSDITSFTQGWQCDNGEEIRLGRNHIAGYGDVNLYTFAMWDYQLCEVEREELFVDAYLPFRPRAQDYTGSDTNEIFATDVNPMPCRPRATSGPVGHGVPGDATDEITLSAVTSKELPDGITVWMRILYGTDPILSSYSTSYSRSQSDPRRQLNVVVFGLRENTKYYWVAQYSIDGIEWFYFPGGKGRFYTQSRFGADFSFSFVTDDHVCNVHQGGPPEDYDSPYVGYGGDIIRSKLAGGDYWDDRKKLFASWRAQYDIYTNKDFNFIVNGGDFYFPDSAEEFNDDLYVEWAYYLGKYYRNWCNLLFKSGVMYSILGNHENECGYQQRSDQDVEQTKCQMICTVARKTFLPNPTSSTYPQGGENETPTNPDVDDWIPSVGNTWVPDISTVSEEDAGATPAHSQVSYDQDYRNEFILGLDIDDPYLPRMHDLYGLNRSPLENYYAWTWGDALFVVLDAYRYTEPGDPRNTSGRHKRHGPIWTLGEIQKKWLRGVLSSSTAKRKFVFAHQLIGGESLSLGGGEASSTQYYGRGSGSLIKRTKTIEGVFDAYNGHTENLEEIELHEMFKQFRVTAYVKGHDHRFCHVVNEEVNYISGATTGAPSQWEESRARDTYGYTEDNDNQTGKRALAGVLTSLNSLGYCYFQISENDATCTNRVCTVKADGFSSDFSVPVIGFEDGASWAGPVYTPDSSGQIVLSERPFNVYTVARVSDTIFPSPHPSIDFNYLLGHGYCTLYPTAGTIDQLVNLWPENGMHDGWEEFHASEVITLDGSAIAGMDEDVRVLHVPVDASTRSLLNAVPETDNSVALHNISPDSAVYVYNINLSGSQEVAEYYRNKRNLPASNLLGLDMSIPTASSCETPISKSEFESTILNPLRQSIAGLEGSVAADSGAFQCAVIILGYGTPLAYTEDDGNVIAIASRLHRINHDYQEKHANHTYDRRGDWKFYDEIDSSQMCLTAVLDGPSVDAVKKLIDRSIAVSGQLFATGKIYVDPYGKKSTAAQLQYQADIIDFIDNEAPNLGLETKVTVDEDDPDLEPTVAYLKNDSFYWGWYNPTYSKDLFLNQNEPRVFLYNADDNGACQIHFVETDGTAFSENGSDPWCNLAINVEPGYAATAGSVGGDDEYGADETGEDAFLRPRPFFEALHRGASLAEAFLFASPYVNWKIILIGDPLMTVTFASDVPAEQDLNNELIHNNETIRRVKEAIEIGLGWGERQLNLIQGLLDTNVDSQYNIAEELYLLYGLTEWRNKKDVTTLHSVYNTPILGLLGYLSETTMLTLAGWLDRENEKITEKLHTALGSMPSRVDIDTDFIYPEGEWEYVFVYTHPRLSFENVHFEMQVSYDTDFTSIVVDVSSRSDVDGWKYEQETDTFVQLVSTGFPSNFSGRRVKFVSPEESRLERTSIYYVRWRAVDSDGTPIAGYETDTDPMLVYR